MTEFKEPASTPKRARDDDDIKLIKDEIKEVKDEIKQINDAITKTLNDKDQSLMTEYKSLLRSKVHQLTLLTTKLTDSMKLESPLPKKWKTDQPAYYIERSFARLDDLSKEMSEQAKRPVLFFRGPSGTGKTTTLSMLFNRMKSKSKNPKEHFFYVDAKYESLDFSPEDAYVFVDNAQCLRQKPELVTHLRHGKSLCFAFSPVIVGERGCSSFSECGFQYTKKYTFKPFTFAEIDEYAQKNNCISQDVVAEMKKIGVFLPRILEQCSTASSVKTWIHETVLSLMLKLQNRLQSDSTVNIWCAVLMKAAMGMEITEAERAHANFTGFFYEDDLGVLQHVFPADILLDHLQRLVLTFYSVFKEYDKGAAFEFLVCAQLRSKRNEIRCIGDNPTPLKDSLSSKSPSCGKPEFYIPPADQYILQADCGDELKCEKSCCLVKLCESHFGIDFLVICNTAGSDSKKLYLIQASTTRYSKRSSPKLKEIYDARNEFGEKSLVKYYCEKTTVQSTQCFFVYACPEIPNADFTRDPAVQNKVYFLEVICS